MAKLGTLLEKLFKKAGIEISDDIKSLVELDTEVPDATATKLDTSLLTVEAAKSNFELTKHFRKSILGIADIKMNELLEELGLQAGDDFTNEQNSYEKIAKLTRLANEAGKKAAAGDKRTADQWAAKEQEYNNQIKALKEAAVAKDKEYNTTRENDLTAFELKQILFGKDYVFPKEMDPNLKVSTALGAVQNALNKAGVSIKRNESGQLVIVNKEGQPAYTSDTNEPLEVNTFIDGALAQNKLLKINDPNQQQPGSPGAQVIPGNKSQGNSAIVAEIDAQMADLNK